MKNYLFIAVFFSLPVAAQPVQQLQKAYEQFASDSQLKHAVSSLYVIDATTGQVVFDRNSQVGLAPASTQKIITSVTAFELLGRDFRYITDVSHSGKIEKGVLKGNIYLLGVGDPTLGSWRWKSTNDSVLLRQWAGELARKGIQQIDGDIIVDESRFPYQTIPDGWIWQDIGNYYGAGATAFNWHENQFDVLFQSGSNIGSKPRIISPVMDVENELTAARKGSGDNAYVYLSSGRRKGLVSGTIPVEEQAFKISAADEDPSGTVINAFRRVLAQQRIQLVSNGVKSGVKSSPALPDLTNITRHYSPSLDSIIYWFNKKSINLYGEALVKTFALQKTGVGYTDTGVLVMREFWKDKGVEEDELNVRDGSGLSPLNRVTTHAQVTILRYAKNRPWFTYFYDALPEYNGMKMKSGTISDVKGFCGYHQSKDGKAYIFSFLVNNYSGKSSSLVGKMYKVLDVLK